MLIRWRVFFQNSTHPIIEATSFVTLTLKCLMRWCEVVVKRRRFIFLAFYFFCTYFCGALYTCANATCRLCMRNSYASTPEVETTHAMYTAYSVVKFHEILLAWKFSLKNFHWKFYGFSVKCYDVSIILLTVFVVIWIFCHLWWKISMTISKNGFENNRKFHEILLSFITKNFTHISTRVAQKRRHRMFRQWWP